jgi:hypothetical protein
LVAFPSVRFDNAAGKTKAVFQAAPLGLKYGTAEKRQFVFWIQAGGRIPIQPCGCTACSGKFFGEKSLAPRGGLPGNVLQGVAGTIGSQPLEIVVLATPVLAFALPAG